ncbi:MAG: excisionase family DNA-binding protein [Bifidobacteriaceae bacterium]|jgi:excisionase family DNA binding protein|nr:excisionase family DNA-binding protein [Bifidobacteriaceae bacterium]
MLILAEHAGQASLAATQKERAQAQDLLKVAWDGELEAVTSGQRVRVPQELARMLRRVVEAVAEGGKVSIADLPLDLTTTEAARQLGVSRPTLMKLIDSGQLAAHKVGSHRRIRTEDLLTLRHAQLEAQRHAFDELLELEAELEANAAE